MFSLNTVLFFAGFGAFDSQNGLRTLIVHGMEEGTNTGQIISQNI
jgi:hypothetical protein